MNERDKIMGGIIPNMEKYVRLTEIERKIKIIMSKDLSRNYSFTQTYADLLNDRSDVLNLLSENFSELRYALNCPELSNNGYCKLRETSNENKSITHYEVCNRECSYIFDWRRKHEKTKR